jgi:hypothetical protein
MLFKFFPASSKLGVSVKLRKLGSVCNNKFEDFDGDDRSTPVPTTLSQEAIKHATNRPDQRNGNALHRHSRRAPFESLPVHRVREVFRGFSHSLQSAAEILLRSSQAIFFPNLFQFIIHSASCHRTYRTVSHNQ